MKWFVAVLLVGGNSFVTDVPADAKKAISAHRGMWDAFAFQANDEDEASDIAQRKINGEDIKVTPVRLD